MQSLFAVQFIQVSLVLEHKNRSQYNALVPWPSFFAILKRLVFEQLVCQNYRKRIRMLCFIQVEFYKQVNRYRGLLCVLKQRKPHFRLRDKQNSWAIIVNWVSRSILDNFFSAFSRVFIRDGFALDIKKRKKVKRSLFSPASGVIVSFYQYTLKF